MMSESFSFVESHKVRDDFINVPNTLLQTIAHYRNSSVARCANALTCVAVVVCLCVCVLLVLWLGFLYVLRVCVCVCICMQHSRSSTRVGVVRFMIACAVMLVYIMCVEINPSDVNVHVDRSPSLYYVLWRGGVTLYIRTCMHLHLLARQIICFSKRVRASGGERAAAPFCVHT